MRQTVLLLALLCHAAPTFAQEPRFPFLLAQPAQTPPPPPAPSEPSPPKPRTATPAEDTGMAGQVAGTALGTGLGVALPAVLLGIIGAAALVGMSSSDNTTPSSTATGTR